MRKFDVSSNMEITVRRICDTDVHQLSVLARQSFFETFQNTCTVADMEGFLEANFNEAKLLDEIRDTGNQYFFAEAGGALAGYLLFAEDYCSFPLTAKWRSLELKRIYVLKSWLGKGIAHQLMNLYLTYASENGFELAWLGVWEHNSRARRFYEKYGFANSGYTHDFPIGDTPQTDLWYWKYLRDDLAVRI